MEQLNSLFLFYNITLNIPKFVYPPKEDTQLVLDNIEISKDDKILEIGTGSGIIAIFCTKQAKEVYATDISSKILENAKYNAKLNNIENIKFIKSDLFENINSKYSKIIFNPPYLPKDKRDTSEIKYSLESGDDGREITDRFIKEVKTYIRKKGTLYLIQSSLNNYKKTISELENRGFDLKIKKINLFFETLTLIEVKLK